MSTVIIFSPELQNPPRKGILYVDGIKLTPGRNVIEDAKFTKLSASSSFEDLVNKEAIKIMKGKPPDDSATNLDSLVTFNIKEAQEMINKEFSTDVLKTWQSNEVKTKERESILNAIARQIKTIESGNL